MGDGVHVLSLTSANSRVIPAQAGIQSVKLFPAEQDNFGFCPLRGLVFSAGFRPPPE
jgi:hypothetical protein